MTASSANCACSFLPAMAMERKSFPCEKGPNAIELRPTPVPQIQKMPNHVHLYTLKGESFHHQKFLFRGEKISQAESEVLRARGAVWCAICDNAASRIRPGHWFKSW